MLVTLTLPMVTFNVSRLAPILHSKVACSIRVEPVSATWPKGSWSSRRSLHTIEAQTSTLHIYLFRRSKAGLPSVAVVFGSSTAGGAYIPGMSDYVVMVKV
jgi:hypothetical protein